MKKTVINPDIGRGFPLLSGSGVEQLVHSEAVKIEFPDYIQLYLSGRTASDENGNLVGRGDIKEQTRQVLRNLQKTVEGHGGTMDDIVRVRVYVTELDREKFGKIHQARQEFFRKEHYPASTMVIVKGLARDGAMIEIDADAVIPRSRG